MSIDTLCHTGLALNINNHGHQDYCSGDHLLIICGYIQQYNGIADDCHYYGTHNRSDDTALATQYGGSAQH